MSNIKIVIADECPLIRRGIFSMLMNMPGIMLNHHSQPKLVLTDEVDSSTALRTLLAKQTPDVLLMGYSLATHQSQNPLNGMDGLGLLKWLNHRFPHLKVMVISPFKHARLIRKVLETGASAYLTRHISERTLSQALQAVLNDEIFIERELMTSIFQGEKKMHDDLSTREIDVLRLLCKGFSLTCIAQYMHLSNKTVSAYKLKAMKKLGVQNDCQLYVLLVKTQMFDLSF